ncbi:GNAT family N-acetyltransferase [Alkalicaulis satelles]|uniref:GNAT family N-acetyltransferase n=1 Tax=Alkalicaulis satelles TaxID=2609175 RepID=A0A5M6ZF22_9PROT|nr:GNAT family protein [Alkalicaulis satelles]KAA5802357.1 GNAT family N-acetyltransferase [Alkalicaulis satelles]
MKLDEAVLEDAHVRLEPLREAHRQALRGPADDPDIWAFMTQRGDGAQFDAWFDKMLTASAGPAQISHAVFDAASGACVGHTAYLEISAPHARVEIGWTWYAAGARGGAVNPACKRLLLAHAFESGAERVELKTHHLNARSQRAIAALGAVREGVLRSHYATWTGQRRDTVMFSVLKDEWPDVRARLDARLSPD